MHKEKISGFTLIELLVVIAIIGLVSTIAFFGFNSAREKPRNARRITDIKQMQKALELYYLENRSYPTVASATVLGGTASRTLCGTSGWAATCTGTPYMSSVPAAIVPVDGGCSSAQNDFTYTSGSTSGTSATYAITFCLGSAVNDLASGVHTASSSGIQ